MEVDADVVLTGPSDLAHQYSAIFPTGNRNAASHKWASFVMQHASTMSHATMKEVFKGFCPISGSPLPDSPHTMYKVTLPKVTGGVLTGITHHCCWPCICDEHDFVQVDTTAITTTNGTKQYNVLVLGDPCQHPAKLQESFADPFSGRQTSLGLEAPELSCTVEGKLQGAAYSDNGYPIVGLFFTDQEDANGVSVAAGSSADDPTFGFGQQCADRKLHGYDSGMGLIFHLMANINPLQRSPTKLYEDGQTSLVEPPKGISESSFFAMLVGSVLVVFVIIGVSVAFKVRRTPSMEPQMIEWMNLRGQTVAQE